MGQTAVVNVDAMLQSMAQITTIVEEVREDSKRLQGVFAQVQAKTNLEYVGSLADCAAGLVKQMSEVAEAVGSVRAAATAYAEKTEELDSKDPALGL